ncbi:hypothetical protein [Legionella massiliensis]|uniref:hypothetical protein n=1 Tax=Legionella massiliensis TaxID=1034943 RepID=UPI0005C47395|nr:hypothetical protein [Legionella massiliensis]
MSKSLTDKDLRQEQLFNLQSLIDDYSYLKKTLITLPSDFACVDNYGADEGALPKQKKPRIKRGY